MIDFHSHILPALDDGSKSLEESRKLLTLEKAQGVDTVVLTPHFYPSRQPLEEFLKERDNSYRTLINDIRGEDFPRLLLGAEVAYFTGISNMENIESLCIEGTNLLLLEMPEAYWTEFIRRELMNLALNRGLRIIIAHIERCIPYQKKATVSELIEMGIIMQANASYFNFRKTRRKALKKIKKGEIHVLGSDCHNTQHRPPRLGEAAEVISLKFSKGFLTRFNRFGEKLLSN